MSRMHAATPVRPASPVTAAPPAAPDMSHERCDICGYRAYVMVMTADGPLAFCAHHFQSNAVALAGVSMVIRDVRNQLAPSIRAGE